MRKIMMLLILFACMTVVNAQAVKELEQPKLVVGLVVDQMRWDYLTRYADNYCDGGFKRLMREGYNCNRCLINYIPAMLKVVDEVISNSVDEFRRKDNMGLTELYVKIDKDNGDIIVKDNGGIPIVKHKEAGIYIPEFIFGQLRTSSKTL